MYKIIINYLINLPRFIKQMTVILIDAVIGISALWIAYSIRMEELYSFSDKDYKIIFICIILYFPIFFYFGFYREIFRYSSLTIFSKVSKAVSIYGIIFFFILIYFSWKGIPRSVGLIQPSIFFILIISSRIIASLLIQNSERIEKKSNVIIYGAGKLGVETLNSINSTRNYNVISFIDDDKSKKNKSIFGIKIHSRKSLPYLVDKNKITDIFISINNISQNAKRELVNLLIKYDVRVRVIPGIGNILSENLLIRDFETLDVLDLIDRKPVLEKLNLELIKDSVVLITGAGGSIGSEICRQIIMESPKKIILLDHNEYGLYQINMDLNEIIEKNNLVLVTENILLNVRNKKKIEHIFSLHNPDIVFHAAAYKHVPLLEKNISESVLNNIHGTFNLASISYGKVKKFILISTDKAVRPTNIMGATKRFAEMCVQLYATKSKINKSNTIYSIVRFGNVLGSSGSVIPLFIKQIKNLGPITLTHPDVKRYMMTIPEAVQLVLQASSIAEGGDILVLEMGEQIKIIDLARRLIKLSGLREKSHKDDSRGDIEIKFIGLRPGEKLYEELVIGNDFKKTNNPLIYTAREDFLNEDLYMQKYDKLIDFAEQENKNNEIIKLLEDSVTGFNFDRK